MSHEDAMKMVLDLTCADICAHSLLILPKVVPWGVAFKQQPESNCSHRSWEQHTALDRLFTLSAITQKVGVVVCHMPVRKPKHQPQGLYSNVIKCWLAKPTLFLIYYRYIFWPWISEDNEAEYVSVFFFNKYFIIGLEVPTCELLLTVTTGGQ